MDTGLTVCPADHLDPTHTCLNNPENHQKTSKTESPEPSADERPTEEGRKGASWCTLHGLAGGSLGGGGGLLAKQSPQVWLARAEGPDGVCSDSKRDLTSGRL